MSNKALSPIELELTQRVQMHFPRDIDPDILAQWNGCSAKTLTHQLRAMFGCSPVEETESATIVTAPIPYLRLLTTAPLTIPACDGTRTIAQATDVFKWGIDGDFKNWGLDVPSKATSTVQADVHELVWEGRFNQFFPSLNSDIKQPCWTQHQIIAFCLEHRGQLRTEGWANFFLFEANNDFFVARVSVYDDGQLDVDVDRFSHDRVWYAKDRHRVVVPRQEGGQAH